MIFITDLDRTLIYSTRVTDEYPTHIDVNSMCVEVNNGIETSYTSEDLINWLSSENKQMIAVANTARSKAEFERITIGEHFDYAIVANGGVILQKGKVLDDWENHINRKEFQSDLIVVHKDISNMRSSNYKPKIIDQSYIFSKVDNLELADDELKNLSEKYKDFRFLRQRNKVYAIPNRISKLKAMKWLEEYTKDKIEIAAGDSENDLEMLKYAKLRIVPEHAELVKQNEEMIMPYIKVRGGVNGSTDIVSILNNAS